MFFTAGNQALYMQTPGENSHESLPTTASPDLNLILLISSPELSKVEKSKYFLTAEDASTERPFFTKTLSSTIIFLHKCISSTTQRTRQAQGPLYFPTHSPVPHLCVIFPERKGLHPDVHQAAKLYTR